MDLCPRPFKGVVVCATGVVDKVRRWDSEQLKVIDRTKSSQLSLNKLWNSEPRLSARSQTVLLIWWQSIMEAPSIQYVSIFDCLFHVLFTFFDFSAL